MLLVTASEADQQRIASVIEQMAQATADERNAKVYRLKVADVNAAEDALQALLPDAQVAADEQNRAIVVTADEAEQARAAAVIEQLDTTTPSDRETRAYALPTADVRAARDAIQALLPDATLAADRDNRTLLVTARAADQQRVADIVQQIGQGQNRGRVTQVYPLQHGDVDAARDALQELLPEAVIAADRANRALLVTAGEDGQARVSQVVTQLDQPGADEPQLQAYSIALGNVQAVADALTGMYEDDSQVSISIDATNRSLLVKAPAVEQRTIAQIVSRMENGAALGQQRTLVAYPADASDPEAMISTFQTLLKNADPPVDLSVNEQTRQLVAVATAAQHAIIAEAARQLQREPHLVEVFPLQTNDPFAIELAIDRLYESESAKPIANGDTQTQQLFVRGTRQQLDEVRQLLVKMGELAAEDGTAQRGVRVVPFRGNAEEAVRQLQQLWPQLRVNPIQVIRPATSEPLLQPAAREIQPIEPIESIESPSDASDDKTEDRRPAASDSSSATESRHVVRGQDAQAEPADEQPARPPIVLIPGSGRITVLSEDEAALNQAEALLRSLARQYPTEGGAGNFTVYSLRNAGARNVTRLMNDLFEQMPFTTRATMGRVSMVADERLNAVIVHGRPADRAVVGELLRVLDSSNVPDSLANPQPQIFAVGYMEAEQMLQILEGVYQTQLQTGGMGPEIEIPEGVPSEVASLLRQFNATASGPLLTLQVDEVTNSIVVLAPRELAQEVGKLIAQLDDNARRNDSRDISIVTLRETNVGQLQEALDQLLRPQ
jgi:type II secretory pathway component GspD/PulD (secretin)